ncbi:MAG: hypothetical protein GX181_04795 [Synergistaceae bacterium]|nr:hypothetical protein [Synergistaceae bacterium]
MRNFDDSGTTGNETGSVGRRCPECGSLVENSFRFCPECGLFVPGTTSGFRAERDELDDEVVRDYDPPEEDFPVDDGEDDYDDEDEDEYDGVVSASYEPRPQRREPLRSNAAMAGAGYREFNAAIGARKTQRDRKGGVFLVVLFFLFVGVLGGGVYWFLQQAGKIPYESSGGKPVAKQPVQPPATREEASVQPLATPGGAPLDLTSLPGSQPLPVSSPVMTDALEILRPTRGVVIGSGVNLRGSHSVSSSVVGKVTAGNEVEVLESWAGDEGTEVVTLADVDLIAADGKTLRLAKGRGLSVLSGPDPNGLIKVALPDDRAKTPYTLSATTVTAPHSWPWYKIRPRGGREGWIFGKFIAVFNPMDNSLSSNVYDRALHTFGETKEGLMASLGAPLKSSVKKVTVSGFDADEDTLGYDGLTAVLLTSGGLTEVKSLTLLSPKHSLDGGLAVGLERLAVLSILGLPNAMERGSEVYRLDARTGIRVRYENYTVKTLHIGNL